MRGLRRFIRNRSRGGALALLTAYALAVQALMASVGSGMSAAAMPNGNDLALCSHSGVAQIPNDRRSPGQPLPRPDCPFCFVAAQSAGHVATVGGEPAVPAYAATQFTAALYAAQGDQTRLHNDRHRPGEPRAPPALSV